MECPCRLKSAPGAMQTDNFCQNAFNPKFPDWHIWEDAEVHKLNVPPPLKLCILTEPHKISLLCFKNCFQFSCFPPSALFACLCFLHSIATSSSHEGLYKSAAPASTALKVDPKMSPFWTSSLYFVPFVLFWSIFGSVLDHKSSVVGQLLLGGLGGTVINVWRHACRPGSRRGPEAATRNRHQSQRPQLVSRPHLSPHNITSLYLSQVEKCICLTLKNVFVLNWQMYLAPEASTGEQATPVSA